MCGFAKKAAHLRAAPARSGEAGLAYGLIAWVGSSWRPWARHALFGASYAGIALLADPVSALPALTLTDVLLPAPLVPLAAIAGGTMGDRLVGWLRQAAAAA